MPEKKYTMRPSQKARSIDNISTTIKDRFQQDRIIFGIVLQISVLNDYDIALCFCESRTQGRSFSLVFGLIDDYKSFSLKRFRVPSIEASSMIIISLFISTASTLRMTSQRVPFSLYTGITMDSFTAG